MAAFGALWGRYWCAHGQWAGKKNMKCHFSRLEAHTHSHTHTSAERARRKEVERCASGFSIASRFYCSHIKPAGSPFGCPFVILWCVRLRAVLAVVQPPAPPSSPGRVIVDKDRKKEKEKEHIQINTCRYMPSQSLHTPSAGTAPRPRGFGCMYVLSPG